MKSEACVCQLVMHTDRSSYYKINKYLCNTFEKLTRAGRTICPLAKGLSETAISWAQNTTDKMRGVKRIPNVRTCQHVNLTLAKILQAKYFIGVSSYLAPMRFD